MMVYMSNQHVDQCPGADRISTGCSPSFESDVALVLNRKDVGATQMLKFCEQIFERIAMTS